MSFARSDFIARAGTIPDEVSPRDASNVGDRMVAIVAGCWERNGVENLRRFGEECALLEMRQLNVDAFSHWHAVTIV